MSQPRDDRQDDVFRPPLAEPSVGAAGGGDQLGFSGGTLQIGLSRGARTTAVADAVGGRAVDPQAHAQPVRRGAVRAVGAAAHRACHIARSLWAVCVSNPALISLGSSGCAILFELDERLCRNTEPPVQTPDHLSVSGRRRLSTSCTRFRLPMNGMRSRG
jgi:hypothetical protein